VLLIAGLAGLFWIVDQLNLIREVAGSTFQYPMTRILILMGTAVATGLVFGLAVAATARSPSTPQPLALIWGLIPLGVLVYFYVLASGMELPRLPGRLTTFVTSNVTIVTCGVVVGLFVSAALAPLVLPSRRRH
jgi:hypothetical protein